MKLEYLVLLHLLAFGATSSHIGSTSQSGYNYVPHGQRHTDFIHSEKHAAYSQPSHFADIQTVKVLHQQGRSGGYADSANDYNALAAYAEKHAPINQDYYVASNSLAEHNSGSNAYNNHASPGSTFIGLSGGYSTGLGNYATDKEHVRVIRVIHEFTPRSHSYGNSANKHKTAKTIKILHEYPQQMHKIVKPSYVPYDHLNGYNSDTNEGSFQDSYETLKSLKAIGIFSKPEQYLPAAPRENFPPTGQSVGGWLKKK